MTTVQMFGVSLLFVMMFVGGYFAHLEILKTQKQILIYKMYVECTQTPNKDQCAYMLKQQPGDILNGKQ